MGKYLTVCDLDETLLTSKKKIKLASRLFIKRYVKRGNYFIIATGRSFINCKKYWDLLPKNMPLISDNGAAIHFIGDNEIKSTYYTIETDVFKDFLNRVENYILCGISTFKNETIIQNIKEVPKWIIQKGDNMVTKEGKLSDLLDHTPLIPNLWVYEDCIKDFLKIIDQYSADFSYRNWGLYDGRYSIEIFSVNASKGLAMEFMAEYYNIPLKNTCAFGDQLNDISMLSKAGYGVSMINAGKEVKEQSKFTTEYDNNHNGVVKFLKKNKLY